MSTQLSTIVLEGKFVKHLKGKEVQLLLNKEQGYTEVIEVRLPGAESGIQMVRSLSGAEAIAPDLRNNVEEEIEKAAAKLFKD